MKVYQELRLFILIDPFASTLFYIEGNANQFAAHHIVVRGALFTIGSATQGKALHYAFWRQVHVSATELGRMCRFH